MIIHKMIKVRTLGFFVGDLTKDTAVIKIVRKSSLILLQIRNVSPEHFKIWRFNRYFNKRYIAAVKNIYR